MARTGNRKKKPAHGRYNSGNHRHKNKLRRATKLLNHLNKIHPDKYKLIGYQVVHADKKFTTRKVRDTQGVTTTAIICEKGQEEIREKRIRDKKRKKLQLVADKRRGRDPWKYSNTRKARHK